MIPSSPAAHLVHAYGYALAGPTPGRFDVEPPAARRRVGPDFGRLQRGETVNGVTARGGDGGETRAGRKIVISGDTAPCQAVEVFAHGADVLVHEATFTEAERGRARETLHSTAKQAAETARDAGVRLLALTRPIAPGRTVSFRSSRSRRRRPG